MLHPLTELPASHSQLGTKTALVVSGTLTGRPPYSLGVRCVSVGVLLVIPLLGSACVTFQDARSTTANGKPVAAVAPHCHDDQATALATPATMPSAPSAATAFQQGQRELQAQHYEQAATFLEQAIALDGAQAEYYLWLGRAYGAQAQQTASGAQFLLARRVRECFEKAVALNPDLLVARQDLLSFYLQAPSLVGGCVRTRPNGGRCCSNVTRYSRLCCRQ